MANPEAKFGDISRLAGEAWKNESAEVKAIYEAKAADDKKRYRENIMILGFNVYLDMLRL